MGDKATQEKFYFEADFENGIHYLQTMAWLNSHRESSQVAGSFLDGKILARSIISTRPIPFRLGYIYKVERGPVACNPEILKSHIKDLMVRFGNSNNVIEINPYSEDPDFIEEMDSFLKEQGWVETEGTRNFYRNSVVVDLTPEIDVIRQSFRKSLKRRINKAVKSEIVPRFTSDTKTIRELFNLFNQLAAQRDFKSLSTEDENFILEQIELRKIKVCAVFLNNQCLGGNFMLLMKDRVLVEWGVFSSDPEHRKFPLAHLVDWECIQWSKAEGYSLFDFAGYWLEQGDDNSINNYKTGFTKNITTTTPEYDFYRSSRLIKILLDYARYRQKNKIKVFSSN